MGRATVRRTDASERARSEERLTTGNLESARMDLEIPDGLLIAVRGAVDLNGEPTGRADGEPHEHGRAGGKFTLKVVAVQVHGEGPVGRPPQRDVVALLDPHDSLVLRQLPVPKRELDDPRLRRGGSTDGDERDDHDDPGRPCRIALHPFLAARRQDYLPRSVRIFATTSVRAAARAGRSLTGRKTVVGTS